MKIKIKMPKKYRQGIKNMFGQKGEEWLEELPEIVNKYIQEFNLTDI